MEKACTKCGVVKDLSEFYGDSKAKDGHRSDCNTCHKELQAELYAENKERAARKRTEWYAKNSHRRIYIGGSNVYL